MNKKNIALILSVVMTASVMLAGCGKKADVPAANSTVSSSATGETATGESATPETSTETVTVDYGVGLKKNGYFKGVKAKKLVTLPADYANIQIPRDDLDLKDMCPAPRTAKLPSSSPLTSIRVTPSCLSVC